MTFPFAHILVISAIIITTIAGPLGPISIATGGDQISNDIDGDEDGGASSLAFDDFTTHGLDRLSSAATCLVAGVEYTHGQQIYRADQCEFCLCLDGEMFCWWQECPPERPLFGPFSPPQSAPISSTPIQAAKTGAVESISSTEFFSSSNEPNFENATTTLTFDSGNATEEEELASSSSLGNLAVEEENTNVCIVMGRKYEIGDKLPHDTGNCVECVCGQGAKVTCSPHQCAPGDGDVEISDYRQPGPRQSDVF